MPYEMLVNSQTRYIEYPDFDETILNDEDTGIQIAKLVGVLGHLAMQTGCITAQKHHLDVQLEKKRGNWRECLTHCEAVLKALRRGDDPTKAPEENAE